MKKVLSLIFALLLLAGSLFCMTPAAFAAEEEEAVEEEEFPDYTTLPFVSQERKLETMEKKLDLYGYELYIEPNTAEVAVVDKASGQVLFTNPYDVAGSKGTTATKEKLLSQIIINFTDNGTAKEYNSYADSAKLGQIIIKEIKNGILADTVKIIFY